MGSSTGPPSSYSTHSTLNLKAVLGLLLSRTLPSIAISLLCLLIIKLPRLFIPHLDDKPWLAILASLSLPLLALAIYQSFLSSSKSVYLLDFVCYRAPDERKLPMASFMAKSRLTQMFTEESLEFQKKILQRSGIGQETYFPPAVTNEPPNPCLEQARCEAEQVMFGTLDELFANTNIKPKDIGILVLNCSVFCPAPSMCAMIVNRYRLRSNIISYNLGGMGCSASPISMGLAKDLLRVHRRTYAVVLCTENITLNWYRGNDKSMLVSNCLFRLGGSAAILSNVRGDKKRAKYELRHIVRTQKAADDACYYCVQQQDDAGGVLGVKLSRELMSVAGNALRTNITTLGPLVLPLSEQLYFFATLIGRKVFKKSLRPYIPDFKRAFEHFCVHSGGRAVLDEVEKNLGLTEVLMEPNRMTLYRFGNTSSSSLWYELAYLEAKGRVKRGDRVWQIGFGSGFKCNSAVWKALRDIHAHNCWSQFIDKFPIDIPAVEIF